MDLTVVYSKTAKGLRARASLIGGLSSQLMRVLSHIDGASKAETILVKLDEITELKLAAVLTQLETEGYIKAIAITNPGTDDWALTSNFAPMVVEDFQGTISAETTEDAEAKTDSQAKLKSDYKAKLKEEVRLQAEAKAQEKEDQARAMAEEKAQLEAERKAEEERIAEAESKAVEKANKQAELKATAAADEARAKALADAKENAKREIERLTREADEAKKQAQAQAEIEAQLKAEAERKAEEEVRKEADLLAQQVQAEQQKTEQEKIQQEAEQARAKAQADTKALADAKAQAEAKAQADAEALASAEAEAAENSRLEAERIALAAMQAQQKSEQEALAKAEQSAQLEAARLEAEAAAAKLEAQRNAEIMEEARLAAAKKAKHEEEERLAAEHELIAQAEEKAKQQAKADEKERARLDIARIVREAEEARKKTEAEAKEARLEAKREEKVAEEQKKAETEAKAKSEQESKKEAERKIKALEEAGLIAESKLKAQAERYQAEAEAKEKASAEANLKASLAMQSFVTDAESAQKNADAEVIEEEAQLNTVQEMNTAASLKAEITAKIKAEQVRAKYEADEKALAEEKELARQEMERISREAELERQKQGSQASSKAPAIANANADAIKVKWANPDDDDYDDDDFKEEERIAGEVEKVGLEIKKKTKRVAEVEGRQEIIRAAQEEAHVKAKSKVESKPFALSKHLGKWASAVRKVLLIYLPPAILLVLLLLHFINISPLVAPIEKLASESLGTPVVIEQIRASLWPRPHLVLKNIAIGADSAQKIEAINIAPVRLGLSEGIKTIKSIDIEGLKIEQENFGLALKWMDSLSKAQNFKVEQITLHKIVLKIKDFELLPLDGKVMLTESRELKTIDLITGDETLAMQITPQGSSFDIALVGTKWVLPMNAKVVFSELKAKGSVKQNSILFDQIEGTIYGGNFTGKAALDWSNQWSLAGKFDLSNANLPEIMKAFASSASVNGKFKLAGIFSCQSKLAATLTNAPEITANFTAQNGKINGVELDRAVLSKNSQSLAGDSTRFDKLTGSVKIKNGSYQYRQLVLRSDQFYADGNVDIQPNQDISGRINADLAAQSRRLQASFTLAGKVNNVKRQ